jgi:hypothetical protein
MGIVVGLQWASPNRSIMVSNVAIESAPTFLVWAGQTPPTSRLSASSFASQAVT